MNRARRLVTGVVVAVVALAVAGGSTAQAESKFAKELITPGTLVVGSDIPYPPFEMGNKPSNYTGFDIQLVRAIGRRLNLRVQIVDTAFDTIFTDLSRGKFDLLASAATVTPERSKMVSFTKPNFEARQSLVVRRGSGIRSLRGLKGKKVGARHGTSGEAFARDETEAARVIGFANPTRAIAALKSGRVDAVFLDETTARIAFREGARGVEIARNFSNGEFYAFATQKSNNRLRLAINWAFDRVKANGTFARLYRKYFGMNPPPSLRR